MATEAEMASSSSSPPAPMWVILGRVALVQHDSIKDPGDLSVKLALPPRVSTPTVPMSVHPNPGYADADRHPYVVAAADDALLLHVSRWPFVGFDLDRDPPGILLVARDFIRTSAAGEGARPTSVVRLPDRARSHLPGIANIKSIGFASLPGTGGADYVVAELCIANSGGDDDRAALLSFRSGANTWVQKDMSCPSMSGRRWMWSCHDVIAHDGKLWWVNLVWGLLGCDPFADEPVLHHVAFQETYPIGHTAELPEDIERRRMVRVSRGKLRFVEVARARAQRPEDTLVVVWTLVLGPSGFASWKQQCATSLARIWASDSYKATGLPAQVPVLALLHPTNPNVVYFFLEKHLFCVNVFQSTVVDYVRRPCRLVEVVAGHKRPPPISWRYVLAWKLPSSLHNANGPSQSQTF